RNAGCCSSAGQASGPWNGSAGSGACASNAVSTSARTATVAKVVGQVEFSTDKGKTFAPLTAGTVLATGDVISTGFDSSATLAFGPDKLTVFHTTSFRIDEFTDSRNLARTRMNLLVGAIQANIPHTNATRRDFSLTTPTCS